MSLLTGNVVDEAGTSIDCQFTLYFYDIATKSDVRSTELNQFNIDTDDADLSNNGTAFSVGSTAILHYYTDTECAVVRVISDGSDSYVFDVQLRACVAPSIALLVSNGEVGKAVVVNQSSSDKFQWDYLGTTHYHKNSWYGTFLCKSVGITSIEYDFGAGYTSSSIHTYTEAGVHTVMAKATNGCGLQTTNSRTLDIFYPAPIVELSNVPVSPLLNETTSVTITNTAPYNNIVSQVWYVDNVEVDSLDQSFTTLGSHEFKAVTTWDDGYTTHQFDTTLAIVMDNQPPTIGMVHSAVDNEHTLTSNAIDPEDNLDYVELKVYIDKVVLLEDANTPNEWILLSTTAVPLNAVIKLLVQGTYKVTMQAFDGSGLSSAIDEVIIDVATTTELNPCGDSTAADTKFIVVGSNVNGSIEVMDVNANIDVVEVNGAIEVVEVSANIEVVE